MRRVRRIVIQELEDAPDATSRKWTLPEEITLATYYGKKKPSHIADYLKKTQAAVHHHARSLGISYLTTEEEREEILRRLQEGDPE